MVQRLGVAGEEAVPGGVRVVHRHVQLRDGDGGRQRDHEGVRKRRVRDAHMGECIGHHAQRGQAHQAFGGVFQADLGAAELAHHARHRPALAIHFTHAFGAELTAIVLTLKLTVQRRVFQVAVQEAGVRRVDAHFHGLQPVAVPLPLEGEAVAGRRGVGVEGWQRRRGRVLGPQIGPDDAALHAHWIAALAHALAQPAGHAVDWRFGRRLQAAAVGGELPAVEGAADAVAFETRERQVGAAVRAVAVQQPPAALVVPEQHEVLPEQAHRLQRPQFHARVQPRVEFVEQRGGLPVASHQLAARGAGADAGEAFVQFGLHGGARSVDVPAV